MMPTYLNDTERTIVVDGIVYQPGDTIITEKILPNLTQVDPAPYYNPILAVNTVTFAAAETQTVTVPTGAEAVKVWKVTDANITVYLRSNTNLPGAQLRPGDSTFINLKGCVDQLVLESDNIGSCEVVFFKTTDEAF